MKKFLFMAFSILFATQIAIADELTANVENTQVVAGEPFELTISYSGTDNNIQPDLSVLQKDFQVYSTGTALQTSYVNGVVNQNRNWTVGLVALHDGNVQIPPIKAGNLSSESIDLKVLPAGSKIATKNTSNESQIADKAKFEVQFSVDEKNPYVKQEVTGTLVIKDYVGLEFASDPTFGSSDEWKISILSQPEVKPLAGGGREIKLNFAMFPLKSGKLKIPSLNWQAYYFDLSDNSAQSRRLGFFDMSGFSMFQSVQKPVILQTKPQEINVKPIPVEYGDYWWLPAKSLSLVSRWSGENPQFKVGETVAREIILSASGVLDSELPELEFEAPVNIKQYPENPQYSLSVYKNNTVAQASYRIVYIPEKSGEQILPEISIKWFNTESGKVEKAIVAPQKIKVKKNSAYKELEEKSENILPSKESQPIKSMNENNDPTTPQNSYLWLAAAFILGMILSRLLFARSTDKSENNGKTLNKIRKNLKNHDYRNLRDNLIRWASENYPEVSVDNLNDLAELIAEENFAEQMQILNRVLYTDSKEIPDAKLILDGLKNSLRRKENAKDSSEPLPRLYE